MGESLGFESSLIYYENKTLYEQDGYLKILRLWELQLQYLLTVSYKYVYCNLHYPKDADLFS